MFAHQAIRGLAVSERASLRHVGRARRLSRRHPTDTRSPVAAPFRTQSRCRVVGKNTPSAGPTRRTVLVTALAAAGGVAASRLLGVRDLGGNRVAGPLDVAGQGPVARAAGPREDPPDTTAAGSVAT